MNNNDNYELDKYGDSRVWYLLPIFLGILGGIIMLISLRKKNITMGKIGLVVGIIITLFPFVFTLGLIWGCHSEFLSISQCDWFKI
jgi:hypothetical protein